MANQEKRRSQAEMFLVIEDWQSSKATKKAFCDQKGISLPVFYYWHKRYKEDQNTGGFVPINVNGAHQNSPSSSIEIEYPNGVIVRLPRQTLPATVRQYLQL